MTQPTGVMWVPMPAVGCWIGWLGADAVFWVWYWKPTHLPYHDSSGHWATKAPMSAFCWVPSHCGIEGNEIVDQLAKETLDHDIDPLTTVHYADLKPVMNSYIQHLGHPGNSSTWQELRRLARADFRFELTSNWPYQGHKVTHLVPRTANCLSALWPDSDHWTHAPGMYCVTANSWRILHSWIIEDLLWDDSRGLHSRVPERSWTLLSDMKGHIFNTTHH